jgi:hypothetical protein
MSETTLHSPLSHDEQASASASAAAAVTGAIKQACDECAGSGGWFRYEPALEPSPGLLYLSCVQCRGSGRTILARA